MKTLSLAAILSVCSVAFGQDSSDLFEKAPPPIDEALRARVHDFYQAHVEGKFREAFKLVAEDSQDIFFAAAKQQYKACETVRINYSEQFTKALVVESCRADWVFHGQSAPMTLPISSNWKLVDGQWYWYYVKPTVVPSPFSPSGFVKVPDTDDAKPGSAPLIPQDPRQAARGILAMVKVDKMNVNLLADQPSKEEIHVRNEMPGSVSISIDPVKVPGFKITAAKTEIEAKGETTVAFEYDGSSSKSPSPVTARIHVNPTGQVFSVQVTFLSKQENAN